MAFPSSKSSAVRPRSAMGRNATRRILAPVFSVLVPIAQLTWANKDVKSVTCAVCQLAMNYIVDQDISEETIEEICEPSLKVGRWLSQLDMINNPETSTGVQIHDLGKPGECRKECSIVARACRQSALTDDNADEVLAVLAKSRENSEGKDETKTKLQQKFCKRKKSVCGSAGGKKHARSWDDEFVEVDPKLGEMEDMMKDMKAKTGMGMKMYSRDDFSKMSMGDMEAMAAREQLAQDRMEARYMSGDMPSAPGSEL